MHLRKRILVTGGAGFLGSHLCRRMLAAGNDVLCVDNFFSSRHNIYDLLDNPDLELMRHDVTFPLYVEVDEIYNLPCPASPIHYQRDPVQTIKTCAHGEINMLGLPKRLGCCIFQASTSEVYGDPTEHPQKDFPGPMNMDSPVEFTIRELAEKIIDLCGSASTIAHEPLPLDDPCRYRPDISLSRKELGWEPKTPLEEGLKKTVAYFDEMLKNGLIQNQA